MPEAWPGAWAQRRFLKRPSENSKPQTGQLLFSEFGGFGGCFWGEEPRATRVSRITFKQLETHQRGG